MRVCAYCEQRYTSLTLHTKHLQLPSYLMRHITLLSSACTNIIMQQNSSLVLSKQLYFKSYYTALISGFSILKISAPDKKKKQNTSGSNFLQDLMQKCQQKDNREFFCFLYMSVPFRPARQ